MAFAAYYDGSGKRDLSAMTLTGVAASECVWQQFEPLWHAALKENGVPDLLFSMTDLMAGQKRFKGWDVPRRRKLLAALFNVFGACKPLGIAAYSCTVFFAAYDRAKLQIPTLRKPEAICVDYCAGGLQLSEEQLSSEPRPILLYFDRNEGFLRTIDWVWRKGLKKRVGWPMQVRNVISVDSTYYPIQAADILAWIGNRNRRQAAALGKAQPYQALALADTLDEHEWLFFNSWFMITHHMRWYDDCQMIIRKYPVG